MPGDQNEEEIAHPTLELYRHTLLRGANTGSLLAVLLAPPILYLRGTRKPRELVHHTARASLYGVVVGTMVGAAMTYMMIRNQTDEQIFDRSYRLRYNKSQNHLDIVTYGMTGTGALAGAVTSPVRGMGALLGGSLGLGLSVFVHMITNKKD